MRNTRKFLVRSAFAASLVALSLAVVPAASAHGRGVGWTIEQGQLCYTWPSHRWACTSHWHRDASGHLISERPGFVPSQTSIGGSRPAPPAASPPPPAGTGGTGGACLRTMPGGVPNDSCEGIQSAPYGGALSLWRTPPAPYDRVYTINPALYAPMWGYWPTCAWWAHETRPDYNPGKPNYRDPRVGATIRYAPGVLGAGMGGHVGHVVAVYSDGWILTSEMNFYWRGGGAGRVIFRFVPAHTSGVTYVY